MVKTIYTHVPLESMELDQWYAQKQEKWKFHGANIYRNNSRGSPRRVLPMLNNSMGVYAVFSTVMAQFKFVHFPTSCATATHR